MVIILWGFVKVNREIKYCFIYYILLFIFKT
nr:MAG TPA: hypothetical protein [Caudoviricetes sp.]